ncbi:MAG: hypothetical protein JRI89_17520 [Deltaproteobacteria bacterium]|nr:hypothetical protein [Deltaproteobacteria bacterium]
MNIKKIVLVLAIGTVLLAYATASWAARGASGIAFLDEQGLSIHARGLRPDSVYTVWFVNTKPKMRETGAGRAPYAFRTDSKGNGVYGSTLARSPFGEWEMIMVVLHPGGDPSTMDNMKYAFKAQIPRFR